jgi:hypothetical protein|tara:strand:- start:1323 stop:1781 length:459 start_codon:yes stop_codon:yes gene_type:complete
MVSESLIAFLTSWIIGNTEFNEKVAPPKIFMLTKSEMSKKACYSSKNCRVKAYYVKNEGIFLRDNLSPEKNICDKSIILHEMIHHYQKSVDRSFDLDEKTLWTLQERQALYYQNLFLISQKRVNDNRGPENILQCEGGSYLDLQYKYRESSQ